MKTNQTLSILAIALLAVGCSSTPMAPAPVVERTIGGASTVYAPAPMPTSNPRPSVATAPVLVQTPAPVVVTPRPVAVIDGKSTVVKKGDTLYGIALENGLSYRDLAEWNGITNPSYIQIDQVLRLTAPAGMVAAAPSGAVAQATPISMSGAAPSTVTNAPALVATPSAVAPSPAAAPAAGDVAWQWPSKGKLTQAFAEGKTKGINISGAMGDPVTAAADGKVVYAGIALKGYGQLLIVKHSEVFLTAYAHNSRLLVKEDASVKRGQKIAEMGNSESDNGQVKLHFELRRSGKPVDPVKLLPPQ
jgi:lipoprotein NlpD